MKENYVILDEIAYENGGYEVIINTSIGTFTGYTEPDEVDAQYRSIYHACEIATAKALRKFAKAAVKQLYREIKLIDNMIRQACDVADEPADIDNNAFRIMNGVLKQKIKEVKKWESRVAGLTNSMTNRIAARDKIVANYIKKDKAE